MTGNFRGLMLAFIAGALHTGGALIALVAALLFIVSYATEG